MKFCRSLLLSLCFLLLDIPTNAQQYLFDTQHLTPADGLSNLMTTAIYQDKSGFIWIGTQYGLNRYNGYTFQLYNKENKALNRDGLIYRISEDEHNAIWLFYLDFKQFYPVDSEVKAIDIFDPITNRAIPFEIYVEGKAPFNVTDIKVTQIHDPKNRIWITTKQGSLFLYHQGVFTKIFEQKGAYYPCISIDDKDQIWLGWEKNLLCINQSGDILKSFTLAHDIYRIWPGKDNQVWLAEQEIDNRFFKLHFEVIDQEKMQLNPFVFPGKPDGFQEQIPGKFFVHRTQEGYWYVNVASNNSFDPNIDVFNDQGEWIFDMHSLLEKNIAPKMENHVEGDHYLWAITSTGLLKMSVEKNPFQLIQSKQGYSDSRGITEDEAGNIYFLNGPIFQWNPQNAQLQQVSSERGSCVLTYMDNSLWSSSYNGHILGFQVDLKTKQETPFTSRNGQGLTFSVLKTQGTGQLLMGREKGLAYLDLSNKKSLPFTQYNGFDILKSTAVFHLHENASGIWLATENGIFLLTEKEGIVQHYNQASNDLPVNHIRHIYEAPDETGKDVFWLATKGDGIIRWEPKGENPSKFRQFTTAEGLSNDYIYAIYGDEYNQLWIPSDKGLMRMDKTTFEVTTYLTEDGLPHNEFNLTSHYQAKDGTLYFGGLGGLISFHPSVFAKESENQTPLEFISYHLLEKDAEKMTDKTALLSTSDEIIIKPSDRLFELQFALIDYDRPEQHGYAYQIEGYDNHWNFIKDNRLRITHLPYGKYLLKIRGKNSIKRWSEKELALKIWVQRPFYLQWWFIAAITVLIAGAILGTMRWRLTSLAKDRRRLENTVKTRTRQLEERTAQVEDHNKVIAAQSERLQELDKSKTHFFANVTHEFRTPLTLIIGPLEQLISEPPPPNIFQKRLNGVLKNAQLLLNLINQMLDLSKIEGGQMRTEVTRGDIVAYTQELTRRFETLAHKKEVRLIFLAHPENWETHFDKDKWDKIVYNLLSNAIKFTKPGGSIHVNLRRIQKEEKELIRLDVTDSGVGIAKDQLEQVFNRFYQADSSSTRTQGGTGIGLALVKELAEIQGGEIRVSSELGKGTTFEVHLPVLETEKQRDLVYEPSPDLVMLTHTEEKEPLATASTGDATESSKLELLLIEDNEEMREYIRFCVDASKYNITEAGDGEEGIQKAQALVPDLIISDLMMPKKNGFEVTEAIRSNKSTSHIPLILLTAKASLESRLEGLKRGADAYLTKPFSPQELTIRIQKLIDIRRLLQQRYENDDQLPPDTIYQKEDEFIVDLQAYILQHIDDPDLGGDHIGKHVGLSRAHLYRKLKALTNQSITEFVRSVRLNKALELIEEGNLNVSEIAYETGFSSIQHFSRAFKKAYGKTPSELKRG